MGEKRGGASPIPGELVSDTYVCSYVLLLTAVTAAVMCHCACLQKMTFHFCNRGLFRIYMAIFSISVFLSCGVVGWRREFRSRGPSYNLHLYLQLRALLVELGAGDTYRRVDQVRSWVVVLRLS